MINYAAVELKVESDMIRTELIPTPGQWWIHVHVDQTMTAKDGKCCLFSPQLLGLKEPPVVKMRMAAHKLGVAIDWVDGAMSGFDSRPLSQVDTSDRYRAGYDFGARMRETHVHAA